MITHAKVSLALATLILTIAAAHTGIASAATPEEDLIAAGEQRSGRQARTVARQRLRRIPEQLEQECFPLAQRL